MRYLPHILLVISELLNHIIKPQMSPQHTKTKKILSCTLYIALYHMKTVPYVDEKSEALL